MSIDLNPTYKATVCLLHLLWLSNVIDDHTYNTFNVNKYILNLYFPEMGVNPNK
jgi:hypothetical protein